MRVGVQLRHQHPTEQAAWAELVGTGTILTIDEPSNPSSSTDATVYTIELDRIWKGEALSRIEVASPNNSASCGLSGFSEGQEIVLFAGHDDIMGEATDTWQANICGGTAPLDEAVTAELTTVLGAPSTVTPSVPAPGRARRAPSGVPRRMVGPLALIAVTSVGAGLVYAGGFGRARRTTA
ncbi:hypothetical protein G7085_13265 [Tessaracoccus sp. HDW20]|uniref:hypothetical protein n=1 Tax=Tessaracoccus coleopterorum TaxID=2714950 RepID=UPI0018D30E6F|nr:hypothetical protein [Tessaracoccus coleopterorum]NHB85276.1 hypothetical protein [Tessaracoccus coleopterorum]